MLPTVKKGAKANVYFPSFLSLYKAYIELFPVLNDSLIESFNMKLIHEKNIKKILILKRSQLTKHITVS